MGASTNINKVFGAIALVEESGALSRISSTYFSPGDVAIVATYDNFYFYRCVLVGGETNLPLIIKPEDALPENLKRWKLISLNYIDGDLALKIGSYLKVGRIKGLDNGDGIKFYNSLSTTEDDFIAHLKNNGALWVNKLEVKEKTLVKNLNAEYIGGHPYNDVILKDGSVPFGQPQVGQDPILPDHLVTKRYVDQLINSIDPDQFMKRDGSTSFLNPVHGVDPSQDSHLATKYYVDLAIENRFNSYEENQTPIYYKNGTTNFSVNTDSIIINFGGILKSYTVFCSVVNTHDSSPSQYLCTVTSKENSSFKVQLSGKIDTVNYYLDWMIVGKALII